MERTIEGKKDSHCQQPETPENEANLLAIILKSGTFPPDKGNNRQ